MTPPQFSPGDPVQVVAGLNTGRLGTVVEPTKIPFGSLTTYAVNFPELGIRIIRSDYLRKVAA